MDDIGQDVLQVRQARLAGAVLQASETVMTMWPLASFIAANPARIMERKPFDEAIQTIDERLAGRGHLSMSAYHAFAAGGLIARDRLREAFERRVGGRTKLAAVAPEITLEELQWRVHFESVFASPPDPTLVDAARGAVERANLAAAPISAQDHGGVLMRTIDKLVVRWLAAYTDIGQAAWPMPHRERGLFGAWQALVGFDPTLSDGARRALAEMLDVARAGSSSAALIRALDAQGVDESAWRAVLETHVQRLPGWVSFLKWRAEQAAPDGIDAAIVTDYLAIRALYGVALRHEVLGEAGDATLGTEADRNHQLDRAAGALARAAIVLGLDEMELRGLSGVELTALVDGLNGLSESAQALIWLEAHEETYRRDLLGRLAQRVVVGAETIEPPPRVERPKAQLVFCIDVRSEPFRRHLEAVGHYETLGFAGFFGVPIAYMGLDEAVTLDVCPALLKPRYRITEEPSPCCAGTAAPHRLGQRRVLQFKKLVSQLKSSAAACFGFVEAMGAAFVLPLVGKTFVPERYAATKARLTARVAPEIEVTPRLDAATSDPTAADPHGLPYGLSAEEKVFFAEASLSIMGLTRGFARLVVLAGHGSRTDNNPYGAALDCGACGGNTGGPSARVLAQILNDAGVRVELAGRGLHVPDDTWFLAAEHNTTTDEVTLFNLAEAPPSHGPDIQTLTEDLKRAREGNCADRCQRLTLTDDGTPSPVAHAERRATDWAQVRPEWGLARNAAFIIAPRWFTAGTDLDGRTFLHSYDWTGDEGGKALEIILTAPMVVAEWINTQYYFSTVDNVRFGSGTKVTHNVCGLIGIMQGNGGDLQIGLPEQSVMSAAGRPYHEPLRLMTLCVAPPARVLAIIEQNAVLQQLFDHAWVALVVVDPTSGAFLRYQPGGTWVREPDGPAARAATSAPSAAGADAPLETAEHGS